jgi:hypothetical protein
MAGLVPAIHVFLADGRTWMPSTRPGMTETIKLSLPHQLQPFVLGQHGDAVLLGFRKF